MAKIIVKDGKYYFKIRNLGGPKGDTGATGATGPQGPQGPYVDVVAGTTTTLPAGSNATVSVQNAGSTSVLNFGIPQGIKGDKGDTGAKGSTGPQGVRGPRGETGAAGQNATVTIGNTTTGTPGSSAQVTNSGTENNAVLNFTLPAGATGATGPANTLSVGTVTGGDSASASITGTAPNQTLNLVLPKGDKGDKGDKGETGNTGYAATIAVGSTSTLNPGQNATVFNRGTEHAAVFDFGIPKGAKGDKGDKGDTGSTGPTGPQGPQGEQGIQGLQGIPGPQGETGPRGSVKSQYVAELPASGDEDTFYLVDKDLESHAESGEYITLETTQTAAAIQSAQIDGNATQTTYRGKNLLDDSTLYHGYYDPWVPSTLVADEKYRVATINNLPAGTYTFSCSLANVYLLRWAINDTNTSINEATSSYTFTTSSTGTFRICFRTEPTAVITASFNTMVESGNQATSYEQYVGGTPAPNPQFPMPISVVTGENVVKVVGKNLWGGLGGSYSRSASGIDFTTNTDGTITASGLAASNAFSCNNALASSNNIYTRLNAGTYYISTEDTLPSGMSLYVNKLSDASTMATAPASFTLAETADVYIVLRVASGTDISTAITVKPQLEQGSSSTTYQACTARDYAISLTGKNLFNKATSTAGYRIDSNGDPYANAAYFISDYIVVQPSTTYAYSRGAAGSGLSTIAYYKSDKTFISRTMPTIGSSDTSGTVTTPNNAYYARFCDVNEVLDSAQLELGSTATEYAAYSPIELAKIGTYQDRIYKDGEKWYVEKQVGKIVYDGSENWSAGEGGGNRRFNLPQNAEMMDGSGRNAILSDYFNANSGNAVGTGFIYQKRIYLYWGTLDNTASDFKSWLSTHPTTVYYALATPTTIEITNQTLIDQLEALASASLNQGVNNIFTEIATGNAMPTLELNWVEWEKCNKHNVYIWNDDIDDWQVIVQ